MKDRQMPNNFIGFIGIQHKTNHMFFSMKHPADIPRVPTHYTYDLPTFNPILLTTEQLHWSRI